MFKKWWLESWQWAGLWLVLILAALYSRPLIPIDETRYLSVAWEMWQRNDFLVPYINGLPYSHKPPLLFWLIQLSWLLFGVSEWSARLIGPLFGFGSIVLTVRLAGLLWPENKDVRLAAPFVLFGTLTWQLYGSLTMFDTLLTFLSLIGLIAIFEARRRKTVFPWLILSLAIGLGILAKGPIILLYLLPVILLAPVWNQASSGSWFRWYGGAFLALLGGIAIALCWALPAAIAGGKEYQYAILFGQTVGRMENSFAHGRPLYWYAVLLPILVFPWFFWIPAWRGLRKIAADKSTRFCLCAIVPPFILLSLVSGKQMHYILPLLPFIALLIAYAVTGSQYRTGISDRLPVLMVYLLLSLIFLVVPQLSLEGGDRDMLKFIPKWIAVVPIVCTFFLFMAKSGATLKSIKRVSLSIFMMVTLLQLAITVPLHGIYNQSEIGNRVRAVQEQGRQVAVFPANLLDQFQFAGRLTQPLLPQKNIDEIAKWSIVNPKGYCLIFTSDKGYELLEGNGYVRQYSNGWLILRPAAEFYGDYEKWVGDLNRRRGL